MDMDKKYFEIWNKIADLKEKLEKTDYQAIKYAEGAISFAEYADMLKQRQEWRAQINALETELKLIRGK